MGNAKPKLATASNSTSRAPRIKWSFRPATYFPLRTRRDELISEVANAAQREELERLRDEGEFEQIDHLLGDTGISKKESRSLGAIHPNLMGGSYLPDLEADEVEIARIRLSSVTWDVTSVYARRGGDVIVYRVVDEYEGMTLAEPTTRISARPLTLKELADFFLDAFLLASILDGNFERRERTARERFYHPSSGFYPEFEQAIRSRVRKAPLPN